MPPIAVTGVGLATSLGFGLGENWRRLLAGESDIRAHEASRFLPPIDVPVRLGAALDRDALAERIRAAVPRGIWNTSAELAHLWLLVVLEALAHAGIDPKQPPVDSGRIGIYAGTGGGPIHFIEQEYANIYAGEKAFQRDVSRMGVPKYMASSLASQTSLLTGFRGPALVLSTACSSGASAILAACDALRLGRVDIAVAGGADMPFAGTTSKGFSNLGALSTRNELGASASRPFDRDRDGFVLGEGAACLVLERAEGAASRGAVTLARLRGGATTAEAHSLLAQKEDGSEIVRCLALALGEAGADAGEVSHVYAHGTSTPTNDRCEALALNRVFPHRPSVSATKALLGHTIGAAAAIDAVLAVQTLHTGRAVPIAHVDTPDPDCALNLAARRDPPNEALRTGTVLVDSFAFGGHNAALLLGAAQSDPD
jgi:3-oxoacyl-[acyl-carrier-protein] synthase II